MESTLRAFIAIEIPNQDTLDQIIRYQQELQKVAGPLKLVERHLIHLTLKFLGEISEKIAQQIYAILEKEINATFFSKGPIEGIIKGVGDFSKKTFFVKLESKNQEESCIEILTQINRKIEEKLLKIPGIKQEDNRFKPHITIARSKDDRKSNNKLNPDIYSTLKTKFQETIFGSWRIEKVVLKKSILTPKGPIYTNLTY